MSVTIESIRQRVSKASSLIATGTVLCLDPANGATSDPGFAIFQGGKLIESGIISTRTTDDTYLRLYDIGHSLRNEFAKPDVLVVEYIHPIPFRVGKGFLFTAAASLQRSVGAIFSSIQCEHIIELPPRIWKASTDEQYVKNDENDAIYMGKYILDVLASINSKRLKTIPPSKLERAPKMKATRKKKKV